jgi:glycosyltransferase involved in cell wall biosynthesis
MQSSRPKILMTTAVRETVRHSIVVPLYNERDNLLQLYEQLKETMEALGDSFELVLVDDGSTDESSSLLRDIALQDGRVTVVTLPRNSGKSAALGAGFEVALGDYIVTMDGDLQHHASDIPRFIEKLREGFDIVCGQRLQRTGDPWMQRLSNRAANWIMAKFSGVRIHDFGSGFKSYKREFVAQLPVYGEMELLIPILALRQGCRICEIPINIAPREHGVSKYGFLRKVPFFFDLITVRFLAGYLSRPMHFFGTAGIAATFAGSAIAFWLLMENFIYHTNVLQEHGPMMFFSTVLILSGMQLFALGLLAEMQVRHFYDRVGGRPPYTVTGARHLAKKNDETIRD